jgi:hypothetical protein
MDRAKNTDCGGEGYVPGKDFVTVDSSLLISVRIAQIILFQKKIKKIEKTVHNIVVQVDIIDKPGTGSVDVSSYSWFNRPRLRIRTRYYG